MFVYINTDMKFKKSNTTCIVKKVRLTRLSRSQKQQCEALLQESGQCYSYIIQHLNELRATKEYLSNSEVKELVKGKYQLHSQSVQAITEKIDGNIKSAIANRNREFKELGYIETQFPYETKRYYPVTWKQFAIVIEDNKLFLSNGAKRDKLEVNVPREYLLEDKIVQVELNKHGKEFCLNFTIDTGLEKPPLNRRANTAGVDLGEIHHAAICTEKGDCLIISGRHLRSLKRQRNRQYKKIYAKLKTKKNKSSLKRARNKISQKLKNQQRDILHKVSRQITDFCVEKNIARVVIGECSSTQDSPNLGKSNNQKISQWTRGQLINYTKQKLRMVSIDTDIIPEDYSSKTCSICKHVKSSSVKGRTYKCSNCKNSIHRDGNGGANICSRGRFGEYGRVQISTIKYLQPIRLRSKMCSSSHGT